MSALKTFWFIMFFSLFIVVSTFVVGELCGLYWAILYFCLAFSGLIAAHDYLDEKYHAELIKKLAAMYANELAEIDKQHAESEENRWNGRL